MNDCARRIDAVVFMSAPHLVALCTAANHSPRKANAGRVLQQEISCS